jgi:hypothetical protein
MATDNLYVIVVVDGGTALEVLVYDDVRVARSAYEEMCRRCETMRGTSRLEDRFDSDEVSWYRVYWRTGGLKLEITLRRTRFRELHR